MTGSVWGAVSSERVTSYIHDRQDMCNSTACAQIAGTTSSSATSQLARFKATTHTKAIKGKSSTDLTVHRYSLILAQCDWGSRPSPCVNSGTRCDLCLSKFLRCLSGQHATAPASRYWKAEENSLLQLNWL